MAEHGLVVFSFAHENTLSGDWLIYFELPHAFMPKHVSVVGTGGAATFEMGTTGDDNAVIESASIGAASDPTEFFQSDFVDADYQYAKGDIMLITITDTNIEDLCVVVTGLFGL